MYYCFWNAIKIWSFRELTLFSYTHIFAQSVVRAPIWFWFGCSSISDICSQREGLHLRKKEKNQVCQLRTKRQIRGKSLSGRKEKDRKVSGCRNKRGKESERHFSFSDKSAAHPVSPDIFMTAFQDYCAEIPRLIWKSISRQGDEV